MPNKFLNDAVEVRRELDLRIGAAFTRFQTLYFQKKFPKSLGIDIISYGSCQFPTLGFVVERFKSIAEFVPEPFWQITVEHTNHNLIVNFEWKRNRLFDKLACEVLLDKCLENGFAVVEKMDNKPRTKYRPKPLNTIDFEKIASKKLKINAKEALQIAESLYSEGLISYPRTETTIFPKELNLKPLVEAQTVDPNWGEFAGRVLKDGLTPFQGNKSDKAHPPIHPIKYSNTLNGKKKVIYDFIVRHFLACLSKNAEGLETVVEIALGGETFVAKGLIVTARNYLDVYPYENWKNKEMPTYSVGDILKPDISMKEGKTSPPELLTESDLLNLMDKYGIGTDATQAEHIETIKARLYVGLKNNKYFIPRTLGMALVESYNTLGYEVSKPKYRADLEADLLRICENQISTEEVVSRHISVYKEMYEGVQSNLDNFFNTLTMFLNVEGRDFEYHNQNDSKSVMKCKSCGSPMILKNRNDNSYILECSKHPVCLEALIFPSIVTNVTATSTVCPKCGPDNHLLKFTFRSENSNKPNHYIGCVGGCDDNLLQILNGVNTEQFNPIISSNLSNINNSDSGFSSASKNLPERISRDFAAPNCYCGLPTTRLQVKKQGVNNNRYFYKCPKQKLSNPCNFFKWENEECFSKEINRRRDETVVAENNLNEVRCYCALPCKRRVVQKLGENKGREFYSCGKAFENLDKCNFFKWVDDKNLSSNQFNSITQNGKHQNRKNKLKRQSQGGRIKF